MAKSDVLVRMKADVQNYDANLAKAKRQLKDFEKANLSAGGVIKQLTGSVLSMAAGYASATAAVGALTGAIRDNIETARGFEKSMSGLSALTGMVGKDLDRLKEYAIELGSSTTLTASQVADAFRLIGSQQPQLLSSGKALKEVTKYAITLSEAAGIDLATASQTLSTSINQMGGDSKNAARYVNVLAAASQKGAGDIAWLGEALVKSATAAKAVGTDYEELVANLEQLAKAGFDASTAGTALRSIIMNLEKQANEDFKPSIVGLTTAFENLKNQHLSLSQYQDLTGKLFASQAMALANASGEARKMTEAITGTNIAMEQATTNTSNLDGALKSLSSAWEGMNLHINDSNSFLTGFVGELATTIRQIDSLIVKFQKLSDDFSDNGFFNFVKNYGKSGLKWWAMSIPGVAPVVGGKWLLDQIAGTPSTGGGGGNVSGLGSNPLAGVIGKFRSTASQAPVVVVEPPKDNGGGGGNGNKNGSKTAKATTEPVSYIEGSLPYMEQQLRAAQTLQSLAPNITEFDSWSMIIEELTRQIQIFKGEYKEVFTPSGPEEGSIDYQIQKVQELTAAWKAATNDTSRLVYAEQMKEQQAILDKMQGKVTTKPTETPRGYKDTLGDVQQLTSSVNSIAGSLEKIGVEIPKGFSDVLGGMQAVITILEAIQTIQTVGSILGIFRNGGIVPHAARGMVIPGNDYADRTPVLASAGELILNRAAQGNIAAQLTSGGVGSANTTPYVDGERIYLGLRNFLLRSGRGEIVTSRK